MSEIYGSGYDSGRHDEHTGNDPWDNYNPEAELERLGITRAGERERADAHWESLQTLPADDQADIGDEDPDRENYADADALLAERGSAWTLRPDAADGAARGDYPYPDSGSPADPVGYKETDSGQTGEPGDTWRQWATDLEAANAELKAENSQLGVELAELETVNADLGKNIAALESRVELLERSAQDKPTALDASREVSYQEVAEKEARQQRSRPEWSSNEAMALGVAAGGGILTTVADYWSLLPATYAGITASVLGVGAAAVALVRRHREVKDGAHRPEH